MNFYEGKIKSRLERTLCLKSTWIKKGSAAMLAIKSSVGVAPAVKMSKPLHLGDDAYKPGTNSGFEAQGRCNQKFKIGVRVAPQKRLMPSKFFSKKQLLCGLKSSIMCCVSLFLPLRGLNSSCNSSHLINRKCEWTITLYYFLDRNSRRFNLVLRNLG